MLPFLNLQQVNQPYLPAIQRAIERVATSGRYILGEEVNQFERSFADYCNARFCIGVGNGFDAIELIFRGYNFSKNSEIIVAANGYIATVLPLIHLGLIPVPVETDPATLLIDTKQIASKISPKTKAILVTHLYGKCCDMDPIRELADRYQLKIIADAAQAHGALYKGVSCTSFADANAFSFYPTKNLGAMGDAGAIITDDAELAEKLTFLRNYGSGKKYLNKYNGINSRIDELQAAILNVKLPYLSAANDRRRQLAQRYFEKLNLKHLVLPPSETIKEDAWHLFVVRHPKRGQLMEHLKNSGIGTEIHYPVPFHLQEAFADYIFPPLPVTEQIHNEALSLPLNTALTDSQLETIVAAVNSFTC